MPTVLICTEPFVAVARREAQAAGLAELPLLTVPAALRELGGDVRRALAERVVDEALRALAGGSRETA